MIRSTAVSTLIAVAFCLTQSMTHANATSAITPLVRAVDLKVGQEVDVELSDGNTAKLKLVDLQEIRDDLRQAVRVARATVEVNGERATLISANYHLPITVGKVQIDCAVTRGCVQPNENPWALDADARFRLWPAGSPWIRPDTFAYPVKQRWFASDTQMSNEPTFVDGGENPVRKDIYYHWGLDFGGAEALVEVVAATDGVVVSAGDDVLASEPKDTPAQARYDVVYVRDARGWYYRYSHLNTIDKTIKPGTEIKMGQRIGLLGKEGGSGGWSHLHFDISAIQPSGRFGTVEGYAFVWQVYHDTHGTQLQAVARPHHVVWAGQSVTLDGSKSWSRLGSTEISDYLWTFTDGSTAAGATVPRRYQHVGQYSEILKVTDSEGREDYDFARVLVMDPDEPAQLPPAIHVVYYPTTDIKVGDGVTFKVRCFAIDADDGIETWDFGDGSPTIETQSDGNANKLAKNGYAITTHRYTKPGHYLVRVQRTNHRGHTAIGHVHVRVQNGVGETPTERKSP